MRWVILEDGTKCEVTKQFDCDGEETDDVEETLAVVAQHPNGMWLAIQVWPEEYVDFAERTLH